MQTDIYYFTSTGNSLFAARMIAQRLGESRIIPIVKTLAGGRPVHGERVIIVFPVYMFRAPHIVCRFLKKLRAAKTVYAIATMGGASGKTFPQIRALLRKNGLDLDAGYTVTMPDNYTPFKGAMAEDEQNDTLKEAVAKIDKIIINLGNSDRTIEKDTPLFQTYLWPGVWYWYAYLIVPKLARYFRVEDSCNGCGTCAWVCPSGTVTLQDNRPHWSAGCLHWCPKEAIPFGKKTRGRKRYRNPSVNIRDIIAQKE